MRQMALAYPATNRNVQADVLPFWQAPPYYGPYAGGYYGDWGGTNFLTGFALGSVLDQHESAGGNNCIDGLPSSTRTTRAASCA